MRWLFAIVVAVLSMTTLVFAQQAKSPDVRARAKSSSIGYPSVGAALASLRAKSGVKISVQGGWTVVEDGLTLWSFTPASHPAHPAVVKRTVVKREGGIFIDMTGLCQAKKSVCDRLMAEFRELNKKTRNRMQRK